MQRCPTCQARLKDAPPACPRCKTELAALLSIEAQAEACLRLAVAHLAAGRQAQALAAVDAALRLERSPFAWLLRGFLSQAGVACAQEPARREVPAEAAPPVVHESHGLGEELAERAAALAQRVAHAVHLPLFHLPDQPPHQRGEHGHPGQQHPPQD